MLALGDLLHELVAERGEVAGDAAADQAVVDHDLLVHPGRPGVGQVGLQARVGRHRAAAQHVGVGEDPAAVADDTDRLVLGEDLADEGDGRLVHAELVAVHHAAGQHQRVVVLRPGVRGGEVHLLLVALLAGDRAGPRGDEHRLGALRRHRLPRLGELGVLVPVGGQERDLLTGQLSHGCTSFSSRDPLHATAGGAIPPTQRAGRVRRPTAGDHLRGRSRRGPGGGTQRERCTRTCPATA